MIAVVMFSLLLSAVQAQNMYRCECAFFAQSQIDDDYFGDQAAAPLYGSFTQMDPNVCLWPDGGVNPCKTWCQNWAEQETSAGFNLCFQTPEVTERCYGGLFCEVLYNEGHINVENDAIRLFYRMPECPADHSTWTDAVYQLNQAICCDEGFYESCYGIDCECYKGEGRRFCECGAFIPEQFDEEGLTALPLAYFGNLTGIFDLGFCNGFGNPTDPCRIECATEGDLYFSSYRLNDIPPGYTDLTYGDLYCIAFKSRYVFFQGLNTVIGAYQRGPECPTIGWLKVQGVDHPERLCCDSDGLHIYPCTTDAPPVLN